jgi:galactokinase
MTGGGFGGPAIVLAASGVNADSMTKAVEEAFAAAGFRAPRTFGAVPAAGPRRVR